MGTAARAASTRCSSITPDYRFDDDESIPGLSQVTMTSQKFLKFREQWYPGRRWTLPNWHPSASLMRSRSCRDSELVNYRRGKNLDY